MKIMKKNHSLVSTIFQIPGSLIKKAKSKVEFSQNQFLRQSCLCYLHKKSISEKLYTKSSVFNYAITFSQVLTDISLNFCFCFYSFDRKNKSLNYAKATLVALKSRDRPYLSYYSQHPLKP